MRCVSHWDRDCSQLSPCDVCRTWSLEKWAYVERTVAREEAKAFLKASEIGSEERRRGKEVPPTDVLGERPRRPDHDISFASDDNAPACNINMNSSSLSNRLSPETRRRQEALVYARKVEPVQGSTAPVGNGYALSPPRGGIEESDPLTSGQLAIQQTPVCHTGASAPREAQGDSLRASSNTAASDAGKFLLGTPQCGQPLVAYTVGVGSRKSATGSRVKAGSSCPASLPSDDRGRGLQPSNAHGYRDPWDAGLVGSTGPGKQAGDFHDGRRASMPGAPRPQPGLTMVSGSRSLGYETPGRGFSLAVDGIVRHPGRLETRVDGPIIERPVSRTGTVILTGSRRRTATATATTSVPWPGDGQAVLDTGFQSPIVTPGHRGKRSPAAGVSEAQLPVLHLDDVRAELCAFKTPAMDRHVRRPPPGFAAPLTPRERMARTRQYQDLFDSPVERAIVGADESWRHVARQDSSTGDTALSVSGDSQTSAEQSYLPFASKIELVREILGEKVPVSVDTREANLRVTSLLSRHDGGKDLHSDRLPLAAVVRSALQVTSDTMRTATVEFPTGPKIATDGCPLTVKALKGTAKFYQVSSPDFKLSAATVPRNLALEQPKATVVLSLKTAKSLEEHSRLGLACASTSEWLLAAVSSILHGCQQSADSVESLGELRASLATALTSSLDLLSSAGRSVQDGTMAIAAGLGELSLARRDSCLRSSSLTVASEDFREKLRNAPIVSPHEPAELPPVDAASDLFGGLISGLREDRQVEASSRSTDLILKAYYGKDARGGHKRQASPRRHPQSKRPRTASSYRQTVPQPVAQAEPRPFSGPPEYRKSRGAKAPRGSFPRGRGGNRSGRR